MAELIGITRRAGLYKIMSLDRFLQMLLSRENTLLRPSMWEDPYESKLEHSDFTTQDGNIIQYSDNLWFGQCWSTEAECDGLWRCYTNNKNTRSVKIKTSVARLADGIEENNQDNAFSFYIGKVEYSQENNFETKLLERTKTINNQIHNWEKGFALSLLLTKRKAFEYEKEVRLMANLNQNNHDLKTMSYSIRSISKMIMHVELDPWTTPDELSTFKNLFSRHGEINEDIVTRSCLYDTADDGYHPRFQLHL